MSVFSVPRQRRSQPAANAATAAPAIPREPEAPAMSRASLTTTPENPSSARSKSWRKTRLIVARFFRSTCGTKTWEVMTTRHPASMAAENGSNSRERSSSRDRLTTGRETWESCAVSPWPGKCFALAATPVDWRPVTQAAPCRTTRSASLPKLRTPMIGLSDRELTSTQGAKSTVQPAWRSDQPIAAAVARVVSRSSSRPSTALPGNDAPVAAKSLVTSPPSSSMAMMACGFSAMIASVRSFSCQDDSMFCAYRQTPPRPARRRSPSQCGSVVPENPGRRVVSTLDARPNPAALPGLTFPLPDAPPINPDAQDLPVRVEENGVGDISRLQPAKLVFHSKNLSRDDCRGFDRREWGQAHLLHSMGDRDVQGEG